MIHAALSKTVGNKYKKFPGDIGLEVETECKIDYEVPKFSFWTVHNDGSLRDIGREFVLKQPLDFENSFPKALNEFQEKTKGIPFIQDSITTSVHTHLNILNDNFTTLGNFLTLYSLVENLLIRASGEDRLSNLFCLPICDAEEIYHNIIRMMDGISKKKYVSMHFEPDNAKYGALNLASISAYGSLEIRSFRGTTDINLIKQWVGTLYSMLKFSRESGLLPPQIVLNYKDRGAEFLTDVFGEYRPFIRHPDEENLIEKNFWYSANIAYSVRDWKALSQEPKPKSPKPKDLERLAMKLYSASFESLSYDQQKNVLRHAGVTQNDHDDQLVTGGTDTPMYIPDEEPEDIMLDEQPDPLINYERILQRARETAERVGAGTAVPRWETTFVPPPTPRDRDR